VNKQLGYRNWQNRHKNETQNTSCYKVYGTYPCFGSSLHT